MCIVVCLNRDSAVGILTAYGLDGRGVGVRGPVRQDFTPLHVVQAGSGAHPASNTMSTGGPFPEGKPAGA
jgi:hypothetical protein